MQPSQDQMTETGYLESIIIIGYNGGKHRSWIRISQMYHLLANKNFSIGKFANTFEVCFQLRLWKFVIYSAKNNKETEFDRNYICILHVLERKENEQRNPIEELYE